jgi:hypothetical protein
MVRRYLFSDHCAIADDLIRTNTHTRKFALSAAVVLLDRTRCSSWHFHPSSGQSLRGHPYTGRAIEVRVLLLMCASSPPPSHHHHVIVSHPHPPYPHQCHPHAILPLRDLCTRAAHGRVVHRPVPARVHLYSLWSRWMATACAPACVACHTPPVGLDPSVSGTARSHPAVRGCPVHGVRVAAQTPSHPLFLSADSAQQDTWCGWCMSSRIVRLRCCCYRQWSDGSDMAARDVDVSQAGVRDVR